MDDIDIRVANKADADDILAMLRSLAEETGDGDRFRCGAGDILEYGFGASPYFECLGTRHFRPRCDGLWHASCCHKRGRHS